MSNIINYGKQGGMRKGEWVRKRIIPLLVLLLVVAITVVLFLFRDRVAELGNYGYLGAFLISLISNATIVLPMPGFLLLFALGAAFNPIFVGLAGATGGAVGESISYLLGYGGRGIVENTKLYEKLVQWLRKWGVLTIFVFAATPLPFDVIGMVAGILRFPLWKFLPALWLGKALKYIGVALAGAYGWEIVLRYLG